MRRRTASGALGRGRGGAELQEPAPHESVSAGAWESCSCLNAIYRQLKHLITGPSERKLPEGQKSKYLINSWGLCCLGQFMGS